jgi:hypothetical protein
MDVSSQALVLPTNYRRQFLTTTRSPMFIDACPIAVSNKIKAIQARKTRLNALTTNTGYTDIRHLNFGCTTGVTNSKGNFTVWTAERLVDRSKDVRLERIPTRQPARRSVLSTTSTNQQSLFWPNYQPSVIGNKKLQTKSNSTITPPPQPPAIGSIKNKPAGGQMPEISRRQNRPPLVDRQNSFNPTELPQKSPERTINHNLPTDETEEEEDEEEEEEEEEIVPDKDFEQYFDQAIVKCADWLLKYVFNEKNP